MGTQGRLRVLLRANTLVTSDLSLPAVLRSIVSAARGVVGARYAALGVIGPSGGLVEFVHEGGCSRRRQREHVPAPWSTRWTRPPDGREEPRSRVAHPASTRGNVFRLKQNITPSEGRMPPNRAGG